MFVAFTLAFTAVTKQYYLHFARNYIHVVLFSLAKITLSKSCCFIL